MTLVMYDAIIPAALPAGADAYLGYVNGAWPTCAAIKTRFPGASFVCLSVTGAATLADGIDVENGDYDQAAGVAWMVQAITGLVAPPGRPVWYESVSQMNSAISALDSAGIQRGEVRLLSAHYGAGQHICGPSTCGLVSTDMDGTQWSNSFAGAGGALVDASELQPDFFGGATVETDTGLVVTTINGVFVAAQAQSDDGQTWTLTGAWQPASS